MADTQVSPLLVALLIALTGGCRGEERDSTPKSKRPSTDPALAPWATVSGGLVVPSGLEPRPRYLRADAKGVLTDATQFPSVPESMVAKEVASASTRRDAAKILHRFGVNPNIDRAGEVSIVKASLVDGLDRERLLIVALFGETDADGMRDEDDFIVFLATTDDDRLIGLGSDVVSARTHESTPIQLDLLELHDAMVDDVVATWSSCTTGVSNSCHGMRAWTMQRGYPERIVDVLGDSPVTIGTARATPHDVTAGSVVLKFDRAKYAYRRDGY